MTLFSVSYLGDLVLSSLTFQDLSERGPLTAVVYEALAPLLVGDARLARVCGIDATKITTKIAIVRRLVEARLRRDRVVNLEMYLPRWRFIERVCRWAGLEAAHLELPLLLEDLRRAKSGQQTSARHVSHYYARAIGLGDAEPPPVSLRVSAAAAARVAARLEAAGVRERGAALIVAHPGSSGSFAAKRGPAGLFSSVIAALRERAPLSVILIGSESERPLCESLLRELPREARALSWAGSLALDELPALLQGADLMLGNDSGPLKVAEAVGARTLSFWGPTAPEFLGPRGPGHRWHRFEAPLEEAVAKALSLFESRAARR